MGIWLSFYNGDTRKNFDYFYSYLDTTRCHRTAPPDQPLPGERSAQSPGYEQVGKAYPVRDGYEREISASAWINFSKYIKDEKTEAGNS